MENKEGKIVKVKEGLPPLYHKNDEFKILKIENEDGDLPIQAMRLRDKQIYYFYEGELE